MNINLAQGDNTFEGRYTWTWNVDPDEGEGDHLTIQDAIDAAIPGVTILVAPGTYNESITIYQKDGLTIKSTDGAGDTIFESANNTSTPWVV